MKKNVVILGSTGSIGENALKVASHLGAEVNVIGVAAHTRIKRLAVQAADFDCTWAYTADTGAVSRLKQLCPDSCRAVTGPATLCELVAAPEVDIVLCAIVGTAGLKPVLSAIRAGKQIALASKEVLVMAGELVMAEVKRCGIPMLPVDSEHCAIFQCLQGQNKADVSRLILTASGGPFRTTPAEELNKVTVQQALAHPTWNMGSKITIDSATLMNKGLELIEARWLFDMPAEKIEPVIHPQSIIHSMVEFVDGCIMAQMGNPDMCLPIQYSFTYPERRPGIIEPMNFQQLVSLDFSPPDHDRFPALVLARQALAAGGTMTAVYNAANEVAVERFCKNDLTFPGIWRQVDKTMSKHTVIKQPSLEDIFAADTWARNVASE